MAMHASNELVHHGAEIALLRDLYRASDSAGRAQIEDLSSSRLRARTTHFNASDNFRQPRHGSVVDVGRTLPLIGLVVCHRDADRREWTGRAGSFVSSSSDWLAAPPMSGAGQ